MTAEAALQLTPAENQANEARLIALVLDGVTSDHSRRSYRTGLVAFFAWLTIIVKSCFESRLA